MVICLERGADLHMAQLMPLPLTVSCFSKILVPAHPGSPGQRAVKRACVCVCVCVRACVRACACASVTDGRHDTLECNRDFVRCSCWPLQSH